MTDPTTTPVDETETPDDPDESAETPAVDAETADLPQDVAAQLEVWNDDGPPPASGPHRMIHTLPSGLPVVPAEQEIAAIAQLATTLSAAAAVPAALRERPNDVFLVLLTARDLGVSLTTAIREFHVIDGKVTCSPKVRLGMVQQARLGRVWADPANDAESATWYAVRADDPTETVRVSTYSMDDARLVRARENKRDITLDQKSNWRQFPRRMLSWRALGYLLDDVFPEVGAGLYSPDDIGAVTDEDGNPVIDVTATEVPAGMREPRRRRIAQAQDEPELISDEDRDDLAGRLAAIKQVPDAASVLAAMWREKLSHPLAELTTRELPIARALVTSIEDRISRGEWADAQPPVESSADATNPPPEDEGSDNDDDPRLLGLVEWVKAMRRVDVVAALAERGIAPGDTDPTARARLVHALYEAGESAPEPPPEGGPEGSSPPAEPEDREGSLRRRLEGMTKRELTAAAVGHFVKSQGTKAELVDRLADYLLSDTDWQPGDDIIPFGDVRDRGDGSPAPSADDDETR